MTPTVDANKSDDDYRECPVTGCPNLHARDNLMCLSHWSSLPKPLRDEVWRTYRSEEGIMGAAYHEARDAAIAFCEAHDNPNAHAQPDGTLHPGAPDG